MGGWVFGIGIENEKNFSQNIDSEFFLVLKFSFMSTNTSLKPIFMFRKSGHGRLG